MHLTLFGLGGGGVMVLFSSQFNLRGALKAASSNICDNAYTFILLKFHVIT